MKSTDNKHRCRETIITLNMRIPTWNFHQLSVDLPEHHHSNLRTTIHVHKIELRHWISLRRIKGIGRIVLAPNHSDQQNMPPGTQRPKSSRRKTTFRAEEGKEWQTAAYNIDPEVWPCNPVREYYKCIVGACSMCESCLTHPRHSSWERTIQRQLQYGSRDGARKKNQNPHAKPWWSADLKRKWN